MTAFLLRFLFLFSVVYLFFPISIVAAASFSDIFVDSNGTKLSDHNPSWHFVNFGGDWGEYEILSNKADSGTGQFYDVNGLTHPLSSHFIVTEQFNYHSQITNNPNTAFMDIRLDDSSNFNSYIFRFFINPQPTAPTTVQSIGPVSLTTTQGTYSSNSTNTISIEYDHGNFAILINGLEVMSFSNNYLVPNKIIINQSKRTGLLSLFSINDLTETPPTPEPTPVPTPTPTPVPTPEPTPTPFPITHFSQRDLLWKENVYDSAQDWSPNTPTFERWGCAVTAASTVLDFYGIHQLPGGFANSPGNLNSWLKSQPDGFFRAGAVNWNAISRATKLVGTTSPVLGIPTTPTLEYEFKGNFPADLQSRLNVNQPVILQEPGHFITAYQYHQDTNTTDIVDPYWTSGPGSKTTLGDYGNTFVSMRTFTPSYTNLGYIFSVSDQDIVPQLFKIQGNSVSPVLETSAHMQEPLQDPLAGSGFSGSPFQILEYAKPEAGRYELHLHREKPGYGSFEIYSYDTDGNSNTSSQSSFFSNTDLIVYLDYSSNGIVTMHKQVNFRSLRQELITGRSLGLLHRGYRGDDLLEVLEAANRLHRIHRPSSRSLMNVFLRLLSIHRSSISPEFLGTLQTDAGLLIQQNY